jgi:two-component system LytT family sensor kinase
VHRISKFTLFQFFGWGLFALFNIYIARLTGELSRGVLLVNLLLACGGWMLSSLFRAFLIQRNWPSLPTEKLLPRIVPALLLGATLYTAWYYLLAALILPGEAGLPAPGRIAASWISAGLLLSIWTGLYFAWLYIENSRAALIRRLQLEAGMKDLEIRTMRSQLQPHFLFNALNSIRALIDEEPELARLALTKMAHILRKSITRQQATDTLSSELELVRDYLDLEKIRFEERLQVEEDIAPETLDIPVPTMMLQTLVENAVKHGISKLERGGRILISTRLEGGQLLLDIRNTGTLPKAGQAQHAESLGFGLHSSRQRLQHLYGEKASLQLLEQGGEVCVHITLPITPKPQPES